MLKLRHEVSNARIALDSSERDRTKERQDAEAAQLTQKMEILALKKALAATQAQLLAADQLAQAALSSLPPPPSALPDDSVAGSAAASAAASVAGSQPPSPTAQAKARRPSSPAPAKGRRPSSPPPLPPPPPPTGAVAPQPLAAGGNPLWVNTRAGRPSTGGLSLSAAAASPRSSQVHALIASDCV